MKSMPFRALLLGLALVSAGATAQGQPRRRSRVVEQVIAVVDGHPVWLSQLRAGLRPLEDALRTRKLSPPEAARATSLVQREVFEHLIDRLLVIEEASRLKLTVTRDEVEKAIDSIAKDNATARENVFAEAHKQGFSDDGYRAEIAAQLLEGKALRIYMARNGLEIKGDANQIEKTMLGYSERWHKELRKTAHIERRFRP